MNLLDAAIVIVLLLAGAAGLYWGMLRQVIALAALIAGLAAVGRYGGAAGDALVSYVADPAMAAVGGALIPLAAIAGGGSLLASALHEYAGLLLARSIDYLLGATLGVAHSALLIAALVTLGQTHPAAAWSPLIDQSMLAPALARMFSFILTPLMTG